ncbi:MAG: DUF5683 domain-containing protein [Bacteroidales bacterium]|nr:DUF5683 domain-containing protein [Bacteroidales bacterium]
MRKSFLISLFFLLCVSAFAQIDLRDSVDIQNGNQTTDASIRIVDEALPVESSSSIEKTHSPKTAALLSTVIPGAGQVYNGSWWKAPIIYAGFAGIGYGLSFYQDYYKSFKTAYNSYRNPYLAQGLTPPADTILTVRGETGYSPVNVQQGRDFYRKYRDLCIIGVSVWYLVNILEAYTEAHLFDFDVSDDLSLHWEPAYYCAPVCRLNPSPLPSGVRFTFSF